MNSRGRAQRPEGRWARTFAILLAQAPLLACESLLVFAQASGGDPAMGALIKAAAASAPSGSSAGASASVPLENSSGPSAVPLSPSAASATGAGGVTPAAVAPGRFAPWRFEMGVGIGSMELLFPVWNREFRENVPSQGVTQTLVSDLRMSHSVEIPLSRWQSLRTGLALSRLQSAGPFGWDTSSLQGATSSGAPDWRSWGLGADVYLLRRFSPNLEIDAGVSGDYLLGGNALLLDSGAQGSVVASRLKAAPPLRLEQASGWRVSVNGGLGGVYLGPVGLVLRFGGSVSSITFREHPKPMEFQGAHVSLGAVLNLGREEP